ncbi:MAG: DASS family sodium-coupled anion symporter [Candidatus Andeanibacterium colombiense]|uniref:DASS family sodium-coupled anion symporter n=1 Tax=Candidatus Andeanibacterium colombiense TaxID=3121345 RepID=A0AAJ5X521_9SPHN|nr:MAG: DASS family sodium-coupled anion symporter [Sphingomonadaceae bacterium]
MSAKRIGLLVGLIAFLLTLALPAPAGMPAPAWIVAGLTVWMAAWWMTEAVPLTATALLPFVVLPFAGVMTADQTAATYYSPILFLILGGAFLALAIERTGLHRRLALAILKAVGTGGGSTRLLFAFMLASAIISMVISNTSTALIMMPMALAVLQGGGADPDDQGGISGALPMGVAFAASIGGLGTLIGSPTNPIAVGLLKESIGLEIGFARWSLYGIPMVLLGVPLAAWIIARVQQTARCPFDVEAARGAIATGAAWTLPEKRLLPVLLAAFLLWVLQEPVLKPLLPSGSVTDGTIGVIAGLSLFLIPDGTGRPLLVWSEADRAPWGVIMMFGGGLALAAGMTRSGLAIWLGQSLLPLSAVPLIVVALAVTAMVIIITEFASNVATASGIIPVVASLIVALGADPILLAVPAAMAASWGFMLPSGTGPNAIAWATGRIRMSRMVAAGIWLDLLGAFLIVGTVWGIESLVR